jgi:hypothetical protein
MPQRSEPAAVAPSTADRLRRNPVIRHGPVSALIILLAVCVTSLVPILRQPAALLAILPLAVVIGLYFWRLRAEA